MGAGGWWVVHTGEAVFDMLVFAAFQGAEIRLYVCKACFKLPVCHCNSETKDSTETNEYVLLDIS